MTRLSEFFEDTDRRLSMSRLGFFIGLMVASAVVLILSLMGGMTEGFLWAYIGLPGAGYIGGKGFDSWAEKASQPSVTVNTQKGGGDVSVPVQPLVPPQVTQAPPAPAPVPDDGGL